MEIISLVEIARDIYIARLILHLENQETEGGASEVAVYPAFSLLHAVLQLHTSHISILCQ